MTAISVLVTLNACGSPRPARVEPALQPPAQDATSARAIDRQASTDANASSPPADLVDNAQPACGGYFEDPPVTDTRTFLLTVVSRFADDPSTLERADLLPKTGPIYVVPEDDNAKAALRAGVPKFHGRSFRVTTRAAMHKEATRRGAWLYYLRIAQVDLGQECGYVVFGVVTATPNWTGELECCCMKYDTYRLIDGAWRFREAVDVSWGHC